MAAVRHATGSRSYTYYFVWSLRLVFESLEAEGTVFGAISKKGFNSIGCLLPAREVVHHFDAVCSPIDDQIERNERESRTPHRRTRRVATQAYQRGVAGEGC